MTEREQTEKKRNETERELVVRQFKQQEEGILHPTYDTELAFYELVSDGNVDALLADYDAKQSGSQTWRRQSVSSAPISAGCFIGRPAAD